MILKFEGIVDSDYEDVSIGGVKVINAINRAWKNAWQRGKGPKVTVALADERFEGDLEADEGMRGYSEWTPGELPTLMVGNHDIWDRLDDLDGLQVTLWIADEPVNVLE